MSLKATESVDEEKVFHDGVDPDAQFGGPEARRKLERKLLWKLDLRMSILVFIYILNYVSSRYGNAAFSL